LHHKTVRKAEMIQQRNEFFHWRFRWRISAPFGEWKLCRRSENMRVRVPGAWWQYRARLARIGNRTCDQRRRCGQRRVSAELDAGFFHDARPTLHLSRHERTEFVRRIGAKIDVEALQSRNDIRLT